MSFIDSIFNSSLFVYLLILAFGIHIYLKRTGKTFPQMIQDIRESLSVFGGDDE